MATFVTNVPVSTPPAAPSPTGNTIGLELRLTPDAARNRALMQVISQGLRVAAVGVVQSFNAGPPATVNVNLATREYVIQGTILNQLKLLLDTTAQQLPTLQDVPVMIYHGGVFSITTPIQTGDECLVVFCDTPLDAWLEGGTSTDSNGEFQGVNPVSQRRHSLSDAVAIVGLFSAPKGLSGYSPDSMQLRNADGTVVIDLADDQITITAPTIQVNCTNATITASQTTTITGDSQVLIGNATKTRDFLSHAHGGVMSGGGSTGPVL